MSSKYQSAGKFHFFRTSAEWKFYGAVSFQVSTFLPQIILHDKFSTLLCSTLCNILRWKKLASEKFFRVEWRVRFVSFELHTAYTWPLCRTLLPTFYERRAVDWVQKCERMRWSCADCWLSQSDFQTSKLLLKTEKLKILCRLRWFWCHLPSC